MRACAGILVACALAGGLGCGGGSNDACGRTQPCGGDVVGTWTVTGGCDAAETRVTAEIVNVIGGSCGMIVRPVSSFHRGMLTFGADMSLTGSLEVGGTVTAMLPESCLGGLSCEAIQSGFLARGVQAHDCTGTSSCTCAIDWGSVASGGTGTYTVADTLLTLLFQNGPAVTKQYCAGGAALHLMEAGATGTTEDLVLAKQ